jgi:hypothetical protein
MGCEAAELSFLEIDLVPGRTLSGGPSVMKSLKLPGFRSRVFDRPGNLVAANVAFLSRGHLKMRGER